MQFFKSKDIKVFPCSYRGTYDLASTESQVFDPEARMLTESNFRMAGRADETFIESFDNNCLKLTFCGYYFEINNVEIDELKGKTLVIKLKEIELSNSEEDDKRITHVLSSLDNSTTVLDHDDGTGFKFTGLAILETNDNSATYEKCQPILEDGTINSQLVRPCPIRGKGAYSIILNDKTNEAEGNYAIAGGENTKANENNAVALGKNTEASGQSSIAVGESTTAKGQGAYAEGYKTEADSGTGTMNKGAHAEGNSTKARGNGAHAEGFQTKAMADFSHAEGGDTQATGGSSHAEGNHTTASGISSHAEGWYTAAAGNYSHAEGSDTIATGNYSHAEGYKNEASGEASHVEGGRAAGEGTTSEAKNAAKGVSSHAEGAGNVAEGSHSHAEGQNNKAVGRNSHAEGCETEASGEASHAEGISTKASAKGAHASGIGTIANTDGQTVVGKYNDPYITNCLFVIGDGKNEAERHNVLAVYSSPTNSTRRMTLDGTLNAQRVVTDGDGIEVIKDDNTWSALTASGLSFSNSYTTVDHDGITTSKLVLKNSEVKIKYLHKIFINKLPANRLTDDGTSTQELTFNCSFEFISDDEYTSATLTWSDLLNALADHNGYLTNGGANYREFKILACNAWTDLKAKDSDNKYSYPITTMFVVKEKLPGAPWLHKLYTGYLYEYCSNAADCHFTYMSDGTELKNYLSISTTKILTID